MKALYLESSAVLSWLLGEPQGSNLSSVFESADFIGTSRLTFIEVRRALIRYENLGSIKASERQKTLGYFEKAVFDWHVMEIDADVEQRASQAFPMEPIRSLDAIHLASALEWLQVYPDLKMLSFDRRILSNLEGLGLQRF